MLYKTCRYTQIVQKDARDTCSLYTHYIVKVKFPARRHKNSNGRNKNRPKVIHVNEYYILCRLSIETRAYTEVLHCISIIQSHSGYILTKPKVLRNLKNFFFVKFYGRFRSAEYFVPKHVSVHMYVWLTCCSIGI